MATDRPKHAIHTEENHKTGFPNPIAETLNKTLDLDKDACRRIGNRSGQKPYKRRVAGSGTIAFMTLWHQKR
jgi:hypothetical protein